MTEKPYELLARFNTDGTIAGVSVRTITTVNGRDYESDPVPLLGATDPAFASFAQAFSAAVVAERDSLAATARELTAESLTLQSTVSELQVELQAKQAALDAALARIDELENPPTVAWRIAPNDFVKRFTAEELIATQMSSDPIVILGRTDIQTIITFIDLKDPQTAMYIGRLVQLGILTEQRASEIMTY